MSTSRRGFTLIEIIVVMGIICTLTAVAWMAIGPAAKARGIESTVRNDLRQLAMATQLYVTDNDGEYPLNLNSLVKSGRTVPVYPSVVKEFMPGCGSGRPQYFLMRNQSIVQLEKRYAADYPFEVNTNPFFKAPFYCRRPGTKETFSTFGDGRWQTVQRDKQVVLGARLDGSVDWFPTWELWEEEFAGKAHRP